MITKLKTQSDPDKPVFYNTYDFETNIQGEVIGAGLYYQDNDLPAYKVFETLEDFLKFILVINPIKKIYAHNGGRFDSLIVLEYLMKHGSKYGVKAYNAPQISGALLYLEIVLQDTKVRLLDSYHLYHASLKKLGQSFGVTQKIDLEGVLPEQIKKINPSLFYDYLRMDCIALSEILTKADLLIKSIAPIKEIGLTSASTSLKMFKTSFLEDDIYTPSKKKLIDFERLSYHGGLVDCEKAGIFPDIYSYDINSMYPSIMVKLPVPISYKGRWVDRYKGETGLYYGYFQQPDNTGPAFLFDENNKRVYTGKGVITSHELEYLLELGGTFELLKGYEFLYTKVIFKDYIEKLYAMRLRAKAEGNDALQFILKLAMNSLYGKFGQKGEGKKWASIDIKKFDEFLKAGKILEINEDKGIWLLKEELETPHTFVSIASFITAVGRITLHKLIMKDKDSFVYSDTDSIHMTRPYPDQSVIGKELGQLKLEYEGSGSYVGAKMYYLHDSEEYKGKFTSKGIPYPKDKVLQETYKDAMNKLALGIGDKKFTAHFTGASTVNDVLRKGKKAGVWYDYHRTITQTSNEVKRYNEAVEYMVQELRQETKELNEFRKSFRKIILFYGGFRLDGHDRQDYIQVIPPDLRRMTGVYPDQMIEFLKMDHPELGITDQQSLYEKLDRLLPN